MIRFFFANTRKHIQQPPNKMSQKYFQNTFEDYSENGLPLMENDLIRQDSKLSLGLNAKWQAAVNKFQHLDFNDYSVYTGTSGVALLKLKRGPQTAEILEEAKTLLSLHRLKNRRHTFLCGDAGPLAIGIVITYKLGKKEEMGELVSRLKSLDKDVINVHSDLPNEYLYGRAGYLYAILYVNKNVSPPPYDDDFVRLIIEAILVSGRNMSRAGRFKCPLMYQWHDSYYLGAAHGLSGILYLLLQAREYLTEDLTTLVQPTIDYLMKQRFPSGNFPSSLGRDNDKYVQWCHGAPGFLYLFTTAYKGSEQIWGILGKDLFFSNARRVNQIFLLSGFSGNLKVFHKAQYLQVALECGDVIWERGLLRKGYSICHGAAGNAYCFLELFQTTKEEKHLYRALKFAEWCFDYTREHEDYSPDRPLSLFEGIAGPMYLLLDIQKPMEAKFPGFTL